MSIKSDNWIIEQAEKNQLIKPFEKEQIREVDNKKVISYGVSSYGYDVRCANEFKIFTNTFSSVVDPKNFDEKRDQNMLCIVENPSDVLAIENSGTFKGKYFVLMGRLSPIDGLGPEELGIPKLIQQITNSNIKEIIVATSPTVEGDATSFYIRDQITKEEVKVTRIAYGVPMGGELEYVDNTTLGRAIQGRREIKE